MIDTQQRTSPRPNEIIDRSKTITFTFNGQDITAHPGDTIASALASNGVKVIGRSFKYHRPRGLMAHGHAMNSMVQIGNEPSVSVWLRPVEEGLVVKSVNAWPSVDNDIMSLTHLGDRFLPVGFYYKTFIHPAFMWPVYERVLRNIAGLGKIDIEAPLATGYDKQYLHADVAVVGGGPAGLSAALAAAQAGARVLLFDDNPVLGGHLAYQAEESQDLAALRTEMAAYNNLKPYTDTVVTGWYDGNWLAAVRGKRLFKIRAEQIIVATGASDQPLIFENNDLPGVLLGSAVQRLVNQYGVAIAQRAIIVTANDDGWQVAADLIAAGITIIGVVDQRERSDTALVDRLEHSGVPTFWRHTIIAAHGNKEVTSAVIAPLTDDGRFNEQAALELPCDLVSVSVAWNPDNGLLYQAGTKIAYDHNRHEFLPETLPMNVYAAGKVTGAHGVEIEMAEGRLAAQAALAALNMGTAPSANTVADIAARKMATPRRSSNRLQSPGQGKQFVDFDEDVTVQDVKTAIAEGYNSIELLKRYSTISMGPSQGKWSSLSTIYLTAAENDWTIEETGTTTSRPPARPIELGALAGQMMEPVRYTPLHDWHKGQGAKFMVAGLWMRPEHYGDPAAEVNAVRERVGLIDVSTLGKFKFTGPGVPDLLDKLYVNKWQKLRVGRVRYGVMCNSEGVVMDDGVTARVGEQTWYTTTTSGGSSSVFEWIQWWMQSGWGDGVHLTNVTEGQAAFNLAGPRSREVLATLTDADLSHDSFGYMRVRDVELAGVPCRLMRIGFTGELSYEIHCASASARFVWESLMTAGADFGISPFGVEAQRILRLEKSHIIVGQDTDALADPISADMAWAVKLDKPDFLGQRPLSRIADQGPRQKLVGFKVITPDVVPEEGLQIVRRIGRNQFDIIGWVTSSRFSPTLNEAIGLCWLPTDMTNEPGVSFNIRRHGELIEARTHHGPFYDPQGARLLGAAAATADHQGSPS